MLDISSRSYTSLDEANTQMSFTLDNSTWQSTSDDKKSVSLVEASQKLDLYFDWNGQKADASQLLKWPRKNATDSDGTLIPLDSIPNEVKYATTVLAQYLLSTGSINFVQSNVESLKVGPISITMNSEDDTSTVIIPESVIALLRSFGSYNGPRSGTSAYNVKVRG